MAIDMPDSLHEVLLPSITSSRLRKIIILVTKERDPGIFFLRMTSMDRQLCGVVDRLHAMEYRHSTLEVELRFSQVECLPGKNDFTEIFPRFREKGVVTVINDACGDLVHRSSTHNR